MPLAVLWLSCLYVNYWIFRIVQTFERIRPIAREQVTQRVFLPLAGRRVLDFTKILAGPLCTQVLADLGAEVVKVEPPGGDDTRFWPPFQDGTGTIFLSVNRNKQSIAIDLKTTEGLSLVRRLGATSDVVVESFGPGVADRLGVGWEAMRAVNPKVVYAAISGYGTQGPMREGKGYDLIAQAFCAMLSITGQADGDVARSPFSPVDQTTGLNAVIGILSALLQVERTGEGVKLEASLFDSAVGLLGYMLQGFWQTGAEPQRRGSAHDSLCPYQAFETADAPIILGIANDALWRCFCARTGNSQWADDARYATGAARVAHRADVVGKVAAILRTRPRAEWLVLCEANGIPASPVHSFAELTAHPHTAASGMVHHSDGFRTVATAIRVNGERLPLRTPPPKLGEHCAQVLAGLGLGNREIRSLTEKGVVRAATPETN
ncbi:MAG: CoA transferase [Sphingomonadales bacterium]|nr:CoA transferase [Sphingomonadales bacterium]